MSRYTACIVLAYFGRLPAHFQHWLLSAGANPNYDWLVVTDDERAWQIPANVRIIPMTFDACKQLIVQRVGVIPERMMPYKMCDYKVTYGLLFEELLEGYDYWGFCDPDMIFGNIDRLNIQGRMGKYPAMQGQGHLAFYQNTPEAKRFFKLKAPGVDYRTTYSISNALAFDEWRGVPALLMSNAINFSHDYTYVDIVPGLPRFSMFYSNNNVRHQLFAWENGKLLGYHLRGDTVSTIEYAYMHMQKRKMPLNDVKPGDNFYLTPRGFQPKPDLGPPSPADIRRLSRPELIRQLRHAARQVARHWRPAPPPEPSLPRQAFHT